MAILTERPDLERVLRESRTIAVVGAHHESHRPASYVPDYLHSQGYRIIPVNPTLLGQTLWGEPVRATLAELAEPIDLIDVFRRGADVIDHVDDMLAMTPLPRVVWLQLGIENHEAAARLSAAGIDVVQDRCTLADHRRFGIGPVQR